MTDITELAQSLKAAAEKATPGEWVYFPKNTSIEYDVGSDESQGSILYVDSGDFTQAQTDRNGEFIALANPANILALVEALEKAQQVDEELCKLLPPGVEYMDPPDGGDVTPLEGVRRMVADYRQRIAELESRTVKLPDDEDGQAYGFGKWANVKLPATAGTMTIAYCEDAWRAAFEVFSSAAGIKVEAE
ncbi:ead/Ea22-like family protein [Klebsiella variicola]|uniref:ead/Ea22-like family protein n=1 Tax=Klebsiella variicola TaxID=244366 RepID=UPI00143D0B53|nr:ead/Ea22-like family protein [Klebsiella variicola]MBA6160557.1 ead/Ea22-like family protein [Klebsiella variicola]